MNSMQALEKEITNIKYYMNNANIKEMLEKANGGEEALEAIEPFEYFAKLKEGLKPIQVEELEAAVKYYADEIVKAKKNNQKRLLDSLLFHAEVALKEMQLKAVGIDKYVLREDIEKFIDIITPKDSIKIIELNRYTRIIPEENSKRIQEVLDLGIFDEMCVLFTDFTDKTYATEEDKKMIERNRDPIVFAYFKEEGERGFGLSKRFYFITDWVDEYCDLTLEKLSDLMIKKNVTKTPVNDLSSNKKIIEQYLKVAKEDKEREKEQEQVKKVLNSQAPVKQSGFFQKLFNFFKK